MDVIATILGLVAGGVIMFVSLLRKKNRYWGALASIISWLLAWLAYSPGSTHPGVIILMIFLTCSLYVGAARWSK